MQNLYKGLDGDQFVWSCTLHRAMKSYTFRYSAGLAHCTHNRPLDVIAKEEVTPSLRDKLSPRQMVDFRDGAHWIYPNEPTLESLLYCMQSDARAGDHSTFEEFASEFGYDEDSRKAEKIWIACREVDAKMRDLLGADYDAFMNENFDE